jgi:hypothetical protein
MQHHTRTFAAVAVWLLWAAVLPAAFQVSPAKVILDSPETTQQLLVTGQYSTGQVRDFTRSVSYEAAPKAIVATARKLAERVYRLLRYGAAYVCQGAEAYEAAYRAKLVKGLARRAAEFGYRLEPVPAGP